MKDKKFTYINESYGKNFTAGQEVLALGKKGILMYGSNYCFVKLENGKIYPYHPNDIKEIEENKDTNVSYEELEHCAECGEELVIKNGRKVCPNDRFE